ncbi:MAG: hypothetical protein ACTTKH_00095 [Treponema sp.]
MRKIIIFCLFVVLFLPIYAQDTPFSRLFYGRNENIYDALYFLSITNGEAMLSNKTPQSQGELQKAISGFDVENLDEASLSTYSYIENRFYRKHLLATDYLKFDIDAFFALQFKLLYQPKYTPYIDQFLSYNSTPPPILIPINILMSNYCFFYTDLVIEKNFAATRLSHTYTNVPFFQRDLDFHFPTRAGMSIGGAFFNISFARGPFNVGRSLSGSMLISDVNDRLDYFNATIFTKNFKMDLNIFQLQHARYVFMHELSFRILKKASITLHEGLLVNSYFDPRYLNPFMIMHNYAPWYDPWQRTSKNSSDEVYTSCQLGITCDIVPIKNLRLYGQFGMNQFQTPSELKSGASYIPNGMGGLLGVEYVHPIFNGYLVATLESSYADPWLYIGKNKWVSFNHYRNEVVSSLKNYKDSTVNIWLANPYGPDTITLFARVGFNNLNKWKLDFIYRFVCKGENEAFYFDKSKEIAPNIYYPYSDEANIKHPDWARWTTPSGVPTYFNTLRLQGFYNIIQNLFLRGEINWTIATGKIAGHALDASLSIEYNIR